MGMWIWFFRKWRREEGKAVPDPVYVESHYSCRLFGVPGQVMTPERTYTVEEFLSEILGKTVPSVGRDPMSIRDGELDTEISNFSPDDIASMTSFLANEGIHLRTFVDYTDGTPAFGLFKLQKQGRLLEKLKEGLPGWRQRQEPALKEAVGLVSLLVMKLEQGYRVGFTA